MLRTSKTTGVVFNKLLGEGASAKVYEGTWWASRELVAIKQFLLGSIFYEERLKAFNREVDIMQKLTNAGAAGTIELIKALVVSTDPEDFIHSTIPIALIIMPLAVNGSLSDWLKDSIVLNFNLQIKITLEIVQAVKFIHDNDIIHRDLKTDNIVLDENFDVKIIDFGLAVTLNEQEVLHGNEYLCGTRNYIAPEIYGYQHSFSKAADIYSMMIVVWEIFARMKIGAFLEMEALFSNMARYSGEMDECSEKMAEYSKEMVEISKKMVKSSEELVIYSETLAEHSKQMAESPEKMDESSDELNKYSEKMAFYSDKMSQFLMKMRDSSDESSDSLIESSDSSLESDSLIENSDSSVETCDNDTPEEMSKATETPEDKEALSMKMKESSMKMKEASKKMEESSKKMAEFINHPDHWSQDLYALSYQRKIPMPAETRCPPSIAKLLMWGWKEQPADRPSDKQVVDSMQQSVNESSHKLRR